MLLQPNNIFFSCVLEKPRGRWVVAVKECTFPRVHTQDLWCFVVQWASGLTLDYVQQQDGRVLFSGVVNSNRKYVHFDDVLAGWLAWKKIWGIFQRC